MMINRKTKFALMLVSVFVVPFALSACGKTSNKQINSNNLDSMVPQNQNNDMVDDKGMMTEESDASDKIEFTDPGNDEIGNDVKEMDALLNQTTPSEYSQEALSDSVIENEVELK